MLRVGVARIGGEMDPVHNATEDEIRALARAAGLDLPPAYMAELIAAYPLLQRMLVRIRRDRTRTDEPAHAFRASAFAPEQ